MKIAVRRSVGEGVQTPFARAERIRLLICRLASIAFNTMAVPIKRNHCRLDAHRRMEKKTTEIGYRAEPGVPHIELVRLGFGVSKIP